jgi:hypothetical protein
MSRRRVLPGTVPGIGVAAALALSSLSHAVPARADTADECIAAAEQSQPLRRDGKLKAAREKMIACSRPECPAVVRSDCTRWLADVETLMPSIVVRAVDSSGADVVGVRVFVDGERQESRFDGRELDVDPGAHTLRLEHDGSAPVEQQIVVRESERHRMISVSFTPAATVPPTPAPSLPAAQDTPSSPSSRSIVLPVALLGAGGVGLAVASYFWVSGLGDRSTMESGCAKTHSCAQSDIDAAHGKLVAGDVVGAAGVVAAVVGAGLLLFGGGSSPARDTPVAVEPVPGGARLEVHGRF